MKEELPLRYFPRLDKIKTLVYVGDHPFKRSQIVVVDKGSGHALVLERSAWQELPKQWEVAQKIQLDLLTKKIQLLEDIQGHSTSKILHLLK